MEDKKKQLIVEYQAAFATSHGKKVLEDLSYQCLENKGTFVDGNTHRSAYNEGARFVILYIRRMLVKDPNEERQQTAKDENNGRTNRSNV